MRSVCVCIVYVCGVKTSAVLKGMHECYLVRRSKIIYTIVVKHYQGADLDTKLMCLNADKFME